MKPLFICN